jgi:hypothetical protein
MDHRIGRFAFGIIIGLLVASLSYQWITNPEGREERETQVSVVEASRLLLESIVATEALEIVDPLAPNRKVGKVYVYPEDSGWAVSGFYRRGEGDRWHPYLMMLDPGSGLVSLKVQDRDQRLAARAEKDPLLEISP